jgi:hypothetical protein
VPTLAGDVVLKVCTKRSILIVQGFSCLLSGKLSIGLVYLLVVG